MLAGLAIFDSFLLLPLTILFRDTNQSAAAGGVGQKTNFAVFGLKLCGNFVCRQVQMIAHHLLHFSKMLRRNVD